MPLKDATVISCKNNLVELAAEVADAARDTPEQFAEELRARLLDHQMQIMTDPAILDPDDLEVSSAVFSRDPLPPVLQATLRSLGFEETDLTGGESGERSLFARFGKHKRAKLDKWRLNYLRAHHISEALAAFEAELIAEMPDGPLPRLHDAGSTLVTRAGRNLGLRLRVDADGLEQIERAIVRERSEFKGRWVFHPAAVRALAAFTGDVIRGQAPQSTWASDPDDDEPLYIRTSSAIAVQSDPVVRVADFIIHGRKAGLTSYAEGVIQQALTASANP